MVNEYFVWTKKTIHGLVVNTPSKDRKPISAVVTPYRVFAATFFQNPALTGLPVPKKSELVFQATDDNRTNLHGCLSKKRSIFGRSKIVPVLTISQLKFSFESTIGAEFWTFCVKFYPSF